MRAPALLPPALLTCCGWLLGPVSATPAPPALPRAPPPPAGSAPAPGCAALPRPAAGLGRGRGQRGRSRGPHPPAGLAGGSRAAGDALDPPRRARRTELRARPGWRRAGRLRLLCPLRRPGFAGNRIQFLARRPSQRSGSGRVLPEAVAGEDGSRVQGRPSRGVGRAWSPPRPHVSEGNWSSLCL